MTYWGADCCAHLKEDVNAQEALDQLGHYEDKGYTPEQVAAMAAELLEARAALKSCSEDDYLALQEVKALYAIVREERDALQAENARLRETVGESREVLAEIIKSPVICIAGETHWYYQTNIDVKLYDELRRLAGGAE